MTAFEKLCIGHACSVMVVCAHPDDEVIGAGAQLPRWRNLSLLYVTDGAPRDLQDAMAAGFASRSEYARARRQELQRVIDLIDVSRSSKLRQRKTNAIELGFADQEAAFHMVEIAHALTEIVRRLEPEFLVTHPYEGGHPDHDSTAFAVRAACSLLRNGGRSPPLIVEMTSYYGRDGTMVSGNFLPSDPHQDVSIELTPEETAFKKRLFSVYGTQERVLDCFNTDRERFRPAPAYDFTSPPHEGRLWYENYSWGVTGRHWRHLTKIALANLGAVTLPRRVQPKRLAGIRPPSSPRDLRNPIHQLLYPEGAPEALISDCT